MQTETLPQNYPAILRLQSFLKKIDHLRLPSPSRRDLESILVRQASDELDRELPWQVGHGKRTAALAILLGQALRLMPNQLHDLKLAALLHDIGLLLLPRHMLTNQEFPDAESYAAVQSHPRTGATLLEPFFFLKEASVLIAHHHERWDGSGYPYGLRGTFIPLGSRILAIADAFDAIKVPEVASRELRDHVAYRIIRVAAGTQFDPSLVQVVERCLTGANQSCLNALHISRRGNRSFQQKDCP